MNEFLNEARALFTDMQRIRRDLHRHPELGFQEVRTAEIVARELNELGLEVRTGIAETGVVALLDGNRPGNTILVRFDMDALPIVEATGAEYASQERGIMHACGHDGHTAIGLGVARILAQRREQMEGTVKFVFQPAEELLSGAERMVEEGVLEDPRPDAALAMHLFNSKPVGWFGITPGPIMAGAESFRIRLLGKGGHGARPDTTRDPIFAALQIANALQGIVSRNLNPLDRGVVSITSIKGGETHNVIPSEVVLQGTIRTYGSKVRNRILERFHSIVEGMAPTLECEAELEIKHLTPGVVNDPGLAAKVQDVAAKLFPDSEIDTDFQNMVSEDMAYLMQDVRGCYALVGSADQSRGLDAPHHDPAFDFAEEALINGAGLLSAAIVELLQSRTAQD